MRATSGNSAARTAGTGGSMSTMELKGRIDNPSVTFVTSDQNWVALSNGTLGGKWAFFTGRLKIRGSQSLARKLDEIFP